MEREVVPGLKKAVDFTEAGKRMLATLAYNGMKPHRAAACFGMSKDWMRMQLKENPELQQLWDQADAFAEAELQAAGMEMAKTNPQQNQFERRVRMGHGVEKKEVDVNHKHYVVGMLPEVSLDDWLEKFSPHKGENDADN